METPAFGTQRRGFFKDGAGMSRSRESSVDDMVAGGFTSSDAMTRSKKLKGSMVEKPTGSSKLVPTSSPRRVNETMVASSQRTTREKLRPRLESKQ